MGKHFVHSVLLAALISCISQAYAETTAVRLGIRQKKSEEKTINRENLMASLSSVRDADFAGEAGESVLAQIRLRAGILAQNISNRNTGLILDLLA